MFNLQDPLQLRKLVKHLFLKLHHLIKPAGTSHLFLDPVILVSLPSVCFHRHTGGNRSGLFVLGTYPVRDLQGFNRSPCACARILPLSLSLSLCLSLCLSLSVSLSVSLSLSLSLSLSPSPSPF